ncbi:hypothetical protein F2Q69_00047723 [Brassica cretica]|uniref:RNase H type-1 domain-containing protein n=1 Tax=Brassica cretica TaxID=69181 RepID=A0A8S9Q0C2_BRACR|nr:hypothetical protein F2Q69_00047723 [Brassica cretica]
MQCLAHCQLRRGFKRNRLRNFTRNHLATQTFTCRVDGSWKHDDATNGVGWILHLQDGSIDLLGLQGGHKEISPLHAELKSLTWALKYLSHHRRYCNHYVTDSQDLIKMTKTPEDWPVFASELSELKTLWEIYHDAKVVYEARSSNTQADFLARQAQTRKRIFSYVSTSVPYWMDTTNSPFSNLY